MQCALEQSQGQDHSLQQEAQLSKVLPSLYWVPGLEMCSSQLLGRSLSQDAQGNEDLWTHGEVFTHK